MQLLSSEWTEAYTAAWNNDEIITKKLRRFSSVFKFSISDRDDIVPVVIEVEKGVCTTYGPEEAFEKIEFDLWADSASWQKAINQEISVEKAMRTKGYGFKGPKLKAMMNMGGFKRCIALMSEMEGVRV